MSLLFWRLGDCLDVFALNVTSDFASKNVSSFCKSPPHSAHRSLELLKSTFAHWEFLSNLIFIK